MLAPGAELTDVLVVGAGPTGLTLACDLRRRGVSCVVVERATEFHRRSRGKGLQPRTLELLSDLGGAQQVLEQGWSRDVRVRWHVGGRLLTELCLAGRDALPDVPFPNVVLLPQWRTEQVLRERLASYGGGVELGCELVDLRQDQDGVTADLRDGAGDRLRQVRARYLVGCDGAHSRVRAVLGLAFSGSTHEERFVFGDVEVDGLDPSVACVWFDGDRYLAASPLPGQRAWQVQASVRPDATGQVEPASLALFQQLFRERTGRDDVHLSNPTWLSDFRSNVRMVERYRVGRVLLAGDAAHVHSPAGGQGMNTGMQDAYNLGWKLGLVLRGEADDVLLDTYEEERLPLARAVLEGTDLGYATVFSTNPLITVVRERVLLPLLRLPRVQQVVLSAGDQLDVHYRGRSLAVERTGPKRGLGLLRQVRDRWARVPRPGDRAPDAELRDLRTSAPTRLFDVMRGPHFTLALFLGPAADVGTRAEALAQEVERLFAPHVRSCVLVSSPRLPQGLRPDRVVLLDTDGQAHRRYGASAGGAYLLRPDGHVATRSAIDDDAVAEYLSSVLPRPSGAPTVGGAGDSGLIGARQVQ